MCLTPRRLDMAEGVGADVVCLFQVSFCGTWRDASRFAMDEGPCGRTAWWLSLRHRASQRAVVSACQIGQDIPGRGERIQVSFGR
jgi:hypothetical protein